MIGFKGERGNALLLIRPYEVLAPVRLSKGFLYFGSLSTNGSNINEPDQ